MNRGNYVISPCFPAYPPIKNPRGLWWASKEKRRTQQENRMGAKWVLREKQRSRKRRAYQAERRQLSKVITYGIPENCSVDLLFTILLKVILKKMNIYISIKII